MTEPAALPWILWNLLPFDFVERGKPCRVDAVEIVGDWLDHDFDDERLAQSVATFLRPQIGRSAITPDGTAVRVAAADGKLRVEWDCHCADLPDLTRAARLLMTADDPPSPPVSGLSKQFEADEPSEFLPRKHLDAPFKHAPLWRPPPVRPTPPRKNRASQKSQLSLF
jgi:hypothetical protein